MGKDKESGSGSDAKDKSFPTIDDVVDKAEELSADLRKMSEFKYPLDVRRASSIRKGVRTRMAKERESKQIKGAGRTYFVDIEETRGGKPYLRITESRKGDDDKFERNSINVFPEDAKKFDKAVSQMISKLGKAKSPRKKTGKDKK